MADFTGLIADREALIDIFIIIMSICGTLWDAYFIILVIHFFFLAPIFFLIVQKWSLQSKVDQSRIKKSSRTSSQKPFCPGHQISKKDYKRQNLWLSCKQLNFCASVLPHHIQFRSFLLHRVTGLRSDGHWAGNVL